MGAGKSVGTFLPIFYGGPGDRGSLSASIARMRTQCFLQSSSIWFSRRAISGDLSSTSGKSSLSSSAQRSSSSRSVVNTATDFVLWERAQERLQEFVRPASRYMCQLTQHVFAPRRRCSIAPGETRDDGCVRHAGGNAWHAGFRGHSSRTKRLEPP
jgi:hypothetical protein